MAKTKTASKMTAAVVASCIRARYRTDKGWLVLDEVADAPGFGARNRIDHCAVGVWGSNAAAVIAFEVKVSRQDWLRELDKPRKRERFCEECNEFWFVCAPGVAEKAEVPEGTGLMVVRGERLVTVVRAPHSKYEPTPAMVATLFRAAVRWAAELEHQNQRFAEFAGRPITVEDLDRLVDLWYGSKLSRLQKQVDAQSPERKERRERSREWAGAVKAVENLGLKIQGYRGERSDRVAAVHWACDLLGEFGTVRRAAENLQVTAERLLGREARDA